MTLDDAELRALPPGSDLRPLLGRRVGIYYHPSCSCRMGPASDALAVVDARGRVHGLDNLYVCDASIYPRLMRANTNLPSAMLAEHLAPAIAAPSQARGGGGGGGGPKPRAGGGGGRGGAPWALHSPTS